MIPLILQQAPLLLAEGRSRTLEEWLTALPQNTLDQTAWLQYWLGACRLPSSIAQSRRHFERAFELFKTQRDPTGIFLAWCGAVETILAEWGDFTLLDHWTGLLEELLRVYPVFPSEEIEARVASTMFCTLMLRQPQHPDIKLWADRAHAVALSSADIHLRMLTGFHLTLYYLWVGDLAKAAALAAWLREVAQSRGVPQHTQLMWAVADACVEWHMASHESCLKTVSESLETARESGIRIWDYQLLGEGVYGALIVGDLATAERFLQQMATVLEGSRLLDASHYHFLTAWHAMLRRDPPRALLHVETALNLAIEGGTPFPQALDHLALAQVLHELGDHRRAANHLAKARRIGTQMNSGMLRFMSLLAEAQFALGKGKEALCVKSLREAMRLGGQQGYVNTPWWRPTVMARLCVKALAEGIEVDYVQHLVRRRGLVPDTPPLDVEDWPWALTIYTLGEFRLVKDEKPLEFSGKVQQRPLAMLKALIAFGGRDVHQDQLADALWPEAESDTALQALATTLHRLRQLAGHEKAIVLREGRVSLDPRYCWVDTWAFERLLEKADAAQKARQTDKTLDCTEKALNLYRGPFLGGDTGEPWAISLRERLRSKFLRQIAKLGQHCEQAGEWRQAIDWYQKGLEVDDLSEEFYQRLISCYQRLGRRAEALAVYRRCRRTLMALAVTPSPETEAMVRALRDE